MVKAPVEQVAEGKRASGQKLVSAVATVSEAMLMTPNKRMWGKTEMESTVNEKLVLRAQVFANEKNPNETTVAETPKL